MSSTESTLIDFTEAGLDLDQAEMEEFLVRLSFEMQSGELVEKAHLTRESELPESTKSGVAAFLVGILTAEINRKNIRKVVDFLGNQFYGKTVTISGEMGGEKIGFTFENLNSDDLDEAMKKLDHIVNLHIKVIEAKNSLEQ